MVRQIPHKNSVVGSNPTIGTNNCDNKLEKKRGKFWCPRCVIEEWPLGCPDCVIDEIIAEEKDREEWLQQKEIYERKHRRLQQEADDMAAAAKGIAIMLGLCPECGADLVKRKFVNYNARQ
jgi:predicted RNA-binding Zn-ribbon protein involved in translation (DUF1610 family)